MEYSLEKAIETRIKNKDKIGIFFSSGIDSNLITALTKKFPNKEIHTYTLGFYDSERNEADKAKELAKYFKTIHHEVYLDNQTAHDLIFELPKIYSEPFSDTSIIPTILLNKTVDKDIEVILTGNGADQLFCGSVIYDDILKYQRIIKDRVLNNIFYRKDNYLKRKKRKFLMNYYNIKPKSYYNISRIFLSKQEKYMLFDLKTFLANREFTKVCFPASNYNLNITHPFIDNKCLDITLKIKYKYKYHKKNRKYILKRILFKRIPKELVDNQKLGFGIPLKKYLFNIYKDDIIKYSEPNILSKQNIFPVDKITSSINKLKNNDESIHYEECYIIFSYFMFQLWYQEYIEDLWKNDVKKYN